MDDVWAVAGRAPSHDGPRPEALVRTPACDRQLVRAATLGDNSAWDQLVRLHAQLVWTTLVSAGLARDEVVATCELVWVRLAQALPDIGGEPVTNWLYRTAVQEGQHTHARAGRGTAHQPWERDRRRLMRGDCG